MVDPEPMNWRTDMNHELYLLAITTWTAFAAAPLAITAAYVIRHVATR